MRIIICILMLGGIFATSYAYTVPGAAIDEGPTIEIVDIGFEMPISMAADYSAVEVPGTLNLAQWSQSKALAIAENVTFQTYANTGPAVRTSDTYLEPAPNSTELESYCLLEPEPHANLCDLYKRVDPGIQHELKQ